MSRPSWIFGAAGLAASVSVFADVTSGPAVGSAVPSLPVIVATGDTAGQKLDYAAGRETRPTVYVLVPAAKWDRPTARLIKKLDTDVTTVSPEARVIGVWLTADAAKTKDYLPKAHQALKLEHTDLAAFDGPVVGPADWKLDDQAAVTVVVANGAKVVATFGFDSPNGTLADGVIESLKKSGAAKK